MAVPRQLLRPAQALTYALIKTSFQPARPTITARLQMPNALPVTQLRTAARISLQKDSKKDPRVQTYVVDEQIGSIYINLVQDDGTFLPEQRLRDVLGDMDRISNFLLRVSNAQQDSEYPYPICRIVPKEELRNMEKEKTKKKKTWEDLTKVVEINWSIAKNDLEHQMKKMTQFLEQGLRVEVVLGPKKRGRPATPQEIQTTLAKVKETVASVPSVKEFAESEGEVGRVLSMYFSKPKELVKEKLAGAAPPNKKDEAEDKSKTPKKVSRYKIKEEEKRKQMAEKAEATKYTELLESRAPPSLQWDNRQRESAYQRDQRLLREDRERYEQARRAGGDPPRTQPPATPSRRPLRADSADFGQKFGGRTGSMLNGLYERPPR